MRRKPKPRPMKPSVKESSKKRASWVGNGTPGPGRPKGVPNKTTAFLKDAILQAAERAGGKDGMVGYLTMQAEQNPGPFMALLGKVLPMQVTGEDGGPIKASIKVTFVKP